MVLFKLLKQGARNISFCSLPRVDMDEFGYVHTSNSARSHSPKMTWIHTQRSQACFKPKPSTWGLSLLDLCPEHRHKVKLWTRSKASIGVLSKAVPWTLHFLLKSAVFPARQRSFLRASELDFRFPFLFIVIFRLCFGLYVYIYLLLPSQKYQKDSSTIYHGLEGVGQRADTKVSLHP